MNDSRKGLLIVFEGIDGTGKSTQIQMLADYLSNNGCSVVVTREPTEGSFGQKIRDLYMNRETVSKEKELQLFIDDRKEHVTQLLQPSLDAGKIILCDRYYLSTAAYQGAAGFDPAAIIEKNNFAPAPDLALLFDLAPDESIKRITASRGDTLNDFEQKESLMAVKRIFDAMNFDYIRKIDASNSVEEVHHTVVSIVRPLLEKGNFLYE